MSLPVILGLLTMANVESDNWVLNAAEREQLRKADQERRKRLLESGKRLDLGKALKTSLRGLSIVRIIVAATAPGVRFSFLLLFQHEMLDRSSILECNTLLGNVSRVWFSTDLDIGMDGCSSAETPHSF